MAGVGKTHGGQKQYGAGAPTKPETECLVAFSFIKDLAILEAAPIPHHHLLSRLGQLPIGLAHRQPLQLEAILPLLDAALLGCTVTRHWRCLNCSTPTAVTGQKDSKREHDTSSEAEDVSRLL